MSLRFRLGARRTRYSRFLGANRMRLEGFISDKSGVPYRGYSPRVRKVAREVTE